MNIGMSIDVVWFCCNGTPMALVWWPFEVWSMSIGVAIRVCCVVLPIFSLAAFVIIYAMWNAIVDLPWWPHGGVGRGRGVFHPPRPTIRIIWWWAVSQPRSMPIHFQYSYNYVNNTSFVSFLGGGLLCSL